VFLLKKSIINKIFKKFSCLGIFLGAMFLFFSSLYAQVPNAAFTSNITADCSPVTVNFTDLSTNSPIGWHWDFGNGNTSTDQNPSAVYKNAGTYTVTLSVSNLDGGDFEKKTSYITVFANPSANYTSDVTSGCKPLSVQFTDQSAPGSGTINSWSWDAGDGSTYNSQNPSHKYNGAGSYNVSLTVKDDNNCESKFFIEDYIAVSDPPTANFTGSPLTGCVNNLTTTFSNISVQGSDNISSWKWDFGDGSTSTSQNPSNSYSGFGSYDVMLIATDQNACSDTFIQTSYIILSDFTVDFDTALSIVCPDLEAQFTDLSTPNPTSWNWDFGDGDKSTSQNPGNKYDATGSYTVKLVATNQFGCTDSMIKSNHIVFNKVNATFTADTTKNCELPLNVTFTNNSTGESPLQYEWRSDIGSLTDNNQNFANNYNVADVYYPSLKVTDGNGCTDSLNIEQQGDSIWIVEPIAEFTTNITSGCTTLSVSFFDASKSTIGTIDQWDWDFGDPASGANNTSSLQFPAHDYAVDGKYSVTLTITNDMGCTDVILKTNYISVGYLPDTVWFTKTKDTACHGQKVQFYDSSLTIINQWFWTFGDGGTDVQQHAQYEVQDTGWVTVQLLAGYNGCQVLSDMIDSVYVLPPKPDFFASPVRPCDPPFVVDFTDLSRKADSWLWKIFDSGGGLVTTYTDTNPTHTFASTGFYNIELVTYRLTCSDSIKRNSYIQISSLQANFGVDTAIQDLEACDQLTVIYTDSSSSNFTINSWYWEFGDGTDTTVFRSDQDFSTTYPAPHKYDSVGSYTVTLTTTDASPCTRSITRVNYLTVHGSIANFTSDTTTFCVPDSVTFSDVTFTTSSIVEREWYFGDGNVDTVSNSATPGNNYMNRGIYDVTLQVTDSEGCVDDTTITKYIIGTFPYPSYTLKSTRKACIGEELTFTSTSTGTGMSFVWDWGDTSNTDTIQASTITHTWPKDSTYYITLTVIDTNGCDSSFIDSMIIVPDPIARIGIDSISVDCPPLPVNFSDSSITSSDDVVNSWFWQFEENGTGITVQNPAYTFLKADTFDVFLAVQSEVGCRDTLILLDTIIVGGPNGSFTMSPLQCCVPCTVTFKPVTQNNATQIWDYGDGSKIDTIADTDSLVWIYNSAANPHPLLLLDDGVGCNELPADEPIADSIIIADPVAGFFMDKTFLCNADSVSFADTSKTNNPSISLTSWLWDFGDGDSSTAQFPSHYFSDTGVITITLYVTNELNQCVASVSDNIVVNAAPNMQLSISQFEGCVPFTVSFIDSSKAISPINYRRWYFGDDSPYDSIKSTTHTYIESGTYTVRLVLYYGDEKCSSWLTGGKFIKAYDTPAANFEIDSTLSIFKDLEIFFSNTSDISNSIGNHGYLWDFDDKLNVGENNSTLENTSHTYFDIGDYNVSMIVSNSSCADTIVKSFYFDNTDFFVPNVFTPWPTSPGINDEFKIDGLPKESKLVIFNRWGQLVYRSDDYLNNWDGGTLEPDIYYYIATNDVRKKSWKGFVKLIRE